MKEFNHFRGRRFARGRGRFVIEDIIVSITIIVSTFANGQNTEGEKGIPIHSSIKVGILKKGPSSIPVRRIEEIDIKVYAASIMEDEFVP